MKTRPTSHRQQFPIPPQIKPTSNTTETNEENKKNKRDSQDFVAVVRVNQDALNENLDN